MGNIAEVAVDVKHPDAKKEYSYLIPDGITVNIGDLVRVPFNKTKINGIVTSIKSHDESLKDIKLKSILRKEPICLTPELVDLSRELAKFYGTALIDFLRLMLPPKANKKQEIVYTALEMAVLSEKAVNQKKVWEFLSSSGPLSCRELSRRLGLPVSSVKTALDGLAKKNMVKKEYRVVRRKPENLLGEQNSRPLALTYEQSNALRTILDNINGQNRTVLLYGITGSGKTEIYIRTIEKVLEKGKKALMLVPEISLTPQMLSIFESRFPGKVAVLHSRLSQGERFDEWQAVYSGKADIVIGARSCIFAPVNNLGLIIIDEEHDSSYKQAEYPFYDARLVAKMRAKRQNAALILGSATPSVESYYKVTRGKYILVKLTKRASGMPLPRIEVVDMREELKAGNRLIFSRKLLDNLKEVLSCKLQAILFLNRRGHSTFVICRDCGFVLKCPHCDISLTYHSDDKTGRCHYCGFRTKAPDLCPACGSRNIRYFGTGTEKVEQELMRLFPEVKALRIDADTITRKGSLERILSDFRDDRAQVLIGTQAVAKGLDFPRVALVGVITADTALNMPDFRAGERAFQLITQVAGRAGRGNIPGKVLVQTYCPESFAIKAACNTGITEFYREELKNRQKANYPPFCHLLNITITGLDRTLVEEVSLKLTKILNPKSLKGAQVYGPAPAPRYRIKDNYRYHLLLKSKRIEALILAEEILKSMKNDHKVKIMWDMDPQDLL